MSDLISNVKKNEREEVRIFLDTYNNHNFVAVRVFYDAGGGEMKPGRQGVSLRPDMLDAILEGLEAAKVAAQQKGWLK